MSDDAIRMRSPFRPINKRDDSRPGDTLPHRNDAKSLKRVSSPERGGDSVHALRVAKTKTNTAEKLLTIDDYNSAQEGENRAVCEALYEELRRGLPEAESKIWHRHPVWFLDGNPVAGYSVLKGGVRLLFWSGQSFGEPELLPEGSFKAAEARYVTPSDIDREALARWLIKARDIQWDYKNIVKRKGVLERLR